MDSFILVTGGMLFIENYFKMNNLNTSIFHQLSMDKYLDAAMSAQANIYYPNLTDEQDNLFEITYEPALSDNSLTALQYAVMYREYAQITKSFNLYIGNLINNSLLSKYADVEKKGDEVYVFYTRP